MPQTLNNKMLRYVQVSSTLCKRALDELQQHRDQQKAAADQRPALVDLLVQRGAIAEHQKQAADRLLQTPEGAFQLLKKAVERIGELERSKTASDLGHGVDPDGPGDGATGGNGRAYNSLTSPFVGQRTTQKKASDLAMLKVLDAPSAV